MVMCVIENKDGQTQHFSKPCFGFMSYIDQWHCEYDEDDNEVESCIPGYEANNLSKLIFEMDVQVREAKNVVDELNTLFAAFPQIYKGFSVEEVRGEDPSVVVDLVGNNMQTTIIGLMMIRNVYESGFYNIVKLLMDRGAPFHKAFLFAQFMYKGYSIRDSSSMYYLVSGDSQIFGNKATVDDVQYVLNGGLGCIYQGVWGETENGYGRYGRYNGDCSAGINPRTGVNYTLTDTLLMPEQGNGVSLASLLGQNGRVYGDEEIIPIYNAVMGADSK
ncbi:hypothetical protein PQC38_gp037 [Aeromonas phage BUCT695]|uniref:hypothetical protein n=1 Tax=Aeromonas phage BUCT695 TaxID=2908630 RepID=UPI0023291BF2|nr:hypothetical protein PQC38_gp037 [Aeromonas phage BUCT695]UIW10513.1 hypothetical protein [Aeromonas phage BUCT695]